MAKCNYTLNLPGGDTIKFPASFSTLERSEDIDNLFNEYTTTEENKENVYNELFQSLKDKLPHEVKDDMLKNIIENSITIDDLYQNLNNAIVKLGTYDNIGSAIINYIKSGKGTSNKNLSDLIQKLSQPRTSDYFKGIGMKGVIGTSSLTSERDRVDAKNIENLEFGFPTGITGNLVEVLNSLKSKYKSESNNNVLYGTNHAFTGKAWSDNDSVMFESDDDLSLFLGLFKREAVKTDTSKLLPILEHLNTSLKPENRISLDTFDINQFFNGKLSGDVIEPSQFEELLEKVENPESVKDIDNIIALIASDIDPNKSGLAFKMKTLFWQLSPASYGKNKLFKEIANQQFIDNESKIEKTYKLSQISFLEMQDIERDNNFSKTEEIPGSNYDEANKNITKYRDIVKFSIPGSDKTPYALVTGMFRRKNGTMIYGVFKDSNGEINNISHLFTESENIPYKNREVPVDPTELDEVVTDIDGATIISKTPFNQKFLKRILRKGDAVSGNVVIGVYPGYVTTKTPSGKIIQNKYKNIKSIRSALALSEIAKEGTFEPKSYLSINNGEDLSEGDFFLYKHGNSQFYKKVLYTDKDNVYSWISGKKGFIITPIKKEGLTGLRNAYGDLNSSEITTIREEIQHIGSSKANFSSFVDPSIAKEGDLFYIEDGENKKYGKVLNNEKVIINDNGYRLITSLDKIKASTFFTTRDISGNYSLFTIRANSNQIEFKPEFEKTDLNVEARYVVPAGTNMESITTLPSGYMNIGSYKSIDRIDPSDIDITNKILEVFDKPKDFKVYFIKESSNSNRYLRNLTSLTSIKYFNKLPTEIKENYDVLQPGTYFSVYDNDYIGSNIYRIESVNGDMVKAHLNKMSPSGKILTTEKIFTKSELLDNTKNNGKSPVNSIARLYLQEGNKKIGGLIKEANELEGRSTDEPREITNKAIHTLIDKLKDYTSGLDMEIQLVDQKGNFEDGQKAKLFTDSSGKTSILINNVLGKTEDVIHEFLHLFLTPLRYKYPEIYDNLIKSVVKDPNLNVTDAEEKFVHSISDKMNSEDDFLDSFEDLNSFVKGMQVVVKDANPEFEISKSDNPISLLNTPLTKLFNVNTKDNTHAMFNESMITTEPMMREWMKKNNIVLNCN